MKRTGFIINSNRNVGVFIGVEKVNVIEELH